MFANARRLCEVFCISQNLQMYEVPERASDGKASGRCSGSPKGFRYIVPRLCVRAGFRSNFLLSCDKLNTKQKASSLHVTPPDAKPVLCVRFSSLVVKVIFVNVEFYCS